MRLIREEGTSRGILGGVRVIEAGEKVCKRIFLAKMHVNL